MLRVSIDVDVMGLGRQLKPQQTLEIMNVGGTETRAEYRYVLKSKNGRTMKEGSIKGWPRKAALACDLVLACLVDARADTPLWE